MPANDRRAGAGHIAVVTPHDCNQPTAVANRHIALARGLASRHVGTRFVMAGTADATALRDRWPDFAWNSTGGRLRPLPRLDPRGLLAVLCIGRDPLVLRRGRRAARRAGVPAFVEQTEFPDVVVPQRAGRTLYLRAIEYEIARMSGIFAISSALLGWAAQVAPAVPAFELPMIVDLARFPVEPDHRSCRCTRSPAAIELGYAGSLNPAKDGLDILLTALAMLPATGAPAVRLRVWGDGPDRAALADQARRLGVADRVTFGGMIPASRIPAALMAADCLVLPRPTSRQAAGGFPTKLGEYLATARPVIATTTGDISAKLSAADAVLVPPDDARALADAMAWVAGHPDAACRLGRAGRRAAEREFSAAVGADRLLSAVAAVGEPPAARRGHRRRQDRPP